MQSLTLTFVCLSAIGCGLMAGLFFAFSNTVMVALARLPASHGMAAMQSINAVILNPVFLCLFFGTALSSLAVLALCAWRRWEPASALLIGGAAAYLLGGFLVTIVRNVPLNNKLDALIPSDAHVEGEWVSYVERWTTWNHVRTVACLAAAVAQTLALPALGDEREFSLVIVATDAKMSQRM